MKYLLLILLTVATGFSQNNSGTLITAPIRPYSPNDPIPSAIANEIKGGPFSVSNVAAMSNIIQERLTPGSLVYVIQDQLFRVYDGTNWSQSLPRTSLGLGATWLTNSNVNNFRTAIELGATNNVYFNSVNMENADVSVNLDPSQGLSIATLSTNTNRYLTGVKDSGFVSFQLGTANSISVNPTGMTFLGVAAGTTRTNLGLGATWLTNTNVTNFRTAIGLGNINISMGVSATNTNTSTFLTGGTNGYLTMKGGDAVAYSSLTEPGGNAGYINLNGGPGGDGDGGNGGYINLGAGTDSGHGGSIDLRGYQYSSGGSIISTGTSTTGVNGGTLNMSAGNTDGYSIRSGGSITTMSGGGSIDTTGTGTIELGISNTRTTLTGTATTNRAISLPDASGTLALTNTLGSWAVTTNASTARTAIELGVSNSPRFTSLTIGDPDSDDIGISTTGITTGFGGISLDPQQLNNNWAVSGAFSWTSNSFAAATRTNLGLGATWLTNSTSPIFSSNGTITSSRFLATEQMGSSSSVNYGVGGTSLTGIGGTTGFEIHGLVSGNIVFSVYSNSFTIRQPLAFLSEGVSGATRTNLGLGSGITATKTFITTNNVTNTVVISNGIITSWTP